ncbi:MAG: hypothetical protein ABSB15_08065 [Bryobacteraceae bacterium]|jgi:hypothetical protein
MLRPFSWPLALLAPAAVALAGLSGSYIMPQEHDAIQYSKGPVDDAVARLQQRMDSGQVRLRYEHEFGYLRSVLKELNVSTTSQVLVFSKTSFQAPKIAPRTPRALYFNDSVTVGFVRTGEVLEFAAIDPKQGVMFYTLDQEQAAHPRFDRRDVCLQCHLSGASMGVPGFMVRSITPDRTGMPVMSEGGFITDHRSPLRDRWGGWYVTGTSGDQSHMGNAVVQYPTEDPKLPISEGTTNVTDLRHFIDTGAYVSPHSDIVALMTLEHQTQMENLITRVGWEARLAKFEPGHSVDEGVEDLLKYMLFSGETALTAPIEGTSGFSAEFESLGPRDPLGRSLRDFDMKTRMFRYPCSYLIYSEAFDSMPQEVKDRLYRRLWEVLTGKDSSPEFAHLTAGDRKAIFEILLATKKGLPGYWPAGPASSRAESSPPHIHRPG